MVLNFIRYQYGFQTNLFIFSISPSLPAAFISCEKDSKHFVMIVKIENESHVGRSRQERGGTITLGCEEGLARELFIGNVDGL